jgi:hypothetical protein
MNVLTAIRDRVPTPESSVAAEAGDSQPVPGAEERLPFPGYERLDARHVMDDLHKHSQIELEAIEAYERSHKDREAVLDKLRWMRGSEPMPDYDALSVEEIMTALGAADSTTIKKVRSYERKFANRPLVLDEVVRIHHRHLKGGTRT